VLRQYTFKGGLQTAADAVASRGDFRIKTGLAAEKISSDGRVFSVMTSGGSFESPMLALAAPASVAARLLREGFPEISGLLSGIRVAAVDSLGVAVRKNDVALGPTAGLIPVDDIFYSVVSRDTVPHDQYRGFTFHFKSGAADQEAKMKRIAEVLGLRRDRLEFTAERENLVPSLRVGHHDLIAKVDRLLAGKPLFLAGNYFGGVAIEDCVSRSLKEFQRLKNALKH
jgi:oxygen-dependent protoporphyrinogen oxidase